MAHLHFPIPRFFTSTQTETPEIIEHINILSLLRKRYKKTWNLPMINKTRRYSGESKVRRTKYFTLQNKTKYFRLRLTDEVSSERPQRDLRVTWDCPETDLRLTWDWPMRERWRFSALDKLVPDRQTDRLTPWAPDGAKNKASCIHNT